MSSAPPRPRPDSPATAARPAASFPAARAPGIWMFEAGAEDRRRGRRSLLASLGMQVVLGAAAAAALAPGRGVGEPAGARAVELVTRLAWTAPERPRAVAARPVPAPVAVPVAAAPRAPAPVAAAPPRPTAPNPAPNPVPNPAPRPPAARATAPRPPAPAPAAAPPVELGRFGAPRGLAEQPGAAVNAPVLGNFGAAAAVAPPAAPAGAAGAAGFGSGAATAGTAAAPGGGIRAGGFGAAAGSAPAGAAAALVAGSGAGAAGFDPAAPPAAVADRAAPAGGDFVPVAISAWPTPQYTAEASQHRVEGEVVLEVRLGADGSVAVLRVVRGLGYGLDEAAEAAARQVRFRPARRGGVAVDWTVVLHMNFRLAY